MQREVPGGGSLGAWIGSTLGGVIGQILGGHRGAIAKGLSQTALTSPLMHTHWQEAFPFFIVKTEINTIKTTATACISFPCLRALKLVELHA